MVDRSVEPTKRGISRLLYRTILYAAALLGSFFLTLLLTEPPAPLDPAKFLAQRVSSSADLVAAASAAGFRLSPHLRGHVDVLTRLNDREVRIAGWLADTEGFAVPLNLIIFVEGSKVAATQTAGERADVTRALNLGFGAEKDVSYQATFACKLGQRPVVAGLGTHGQYMEIAAPPCP